MAADMSDIVKQGYLRCKTRSLGLWAKRWLILRSTSNKGPCRLEKYADETAARAGDLSKVQLLTSVATVRRGTQPKQATFTISFTDGTRRTFACDSELEADNWVKLTVQECFLPTSGIASGEPDILQPGIAKELTELFRVYLVPSSKLETLYGECLLQVTHENIYLWDLANSKLKLCAWPLTALRRYGSDMTKFTFEAGRHCDTGEGMFIFHTLEGEKIYRKVHQATLAIAEAHQRMKRHLLPSLTPEGSSSAFTGTTTTGTRPQSEEGTATFKLSNTSGQLRAPFNETTTRSLSEERGASPEESSWYQDDADSETTPLASQLYTHRRHLQASPFQMDHSPRLFQAAN